jgi:hypothetical protein
MRDMDFENKVLRKWLNLRQSAYKRGLEFDLTLGEVKRLMLRKTCFFLKSKIYVIPPNGAEEEDSLTIDRVDSTKGYVKGNVVACSSRINQAKSDLSLKELKTLVEVMEKFENDRNE